MTKSTLLGRSATAVGKKVKIQSNRLYFRHQGGLTKCVLYGYVGLGVFELIMC